MRKKNQQCRSSQREVITVCARRIYDCHGNKYWTTNWKAGKTGTKTYELLRKAYGEECVSHVTTFLWFGKFRDDREDVQDNEWAGRPCTSRTDDNIAAVRAALQHDCRSTVRLLEEQLHINREMICHINTEDLGKKKSALASCHTR